MLDFVLIIKTSYKTYKKMYLKLVHDPLSSSTVGNHSINILSIHIPNVYFNYFVILSLSNENSIFFLGNSIYIKEILNLWSKLKGLAYFIFVHASFDKVFKSLFFEY